LIHILPALETNRISRGNEWGGNFQSAGSNLYCLSATASSYVAFVGVADRVDAGAPFGDARAADNHDDFNQSAAAA
jgi:hypothetical protein